MKTPLRTALVAALTLIGLAVVVVVGAVVVRSRSTVVFEGDSMFGAVRVIERADGLRALYTGEGRARQSAIFPGRPEHLELLYTRVAMIGPALVPERARMLFVGLGGGAMPMFVHHIRPSARIDVVEIDPLIVEVAPRFFGFRPDATLMIHTGDGRAFIEAAAPEAWDLIVLDAFSDADIPTALTTVEFLEAVHTALAPEGVVISNLHTSAREYPAMVATYASVFGEVRLVQVPGRRQVILIASDREIGQLVLVDAAERFVFEAQPGFDLARLVREGDHEPPAIGSILRDGG